MYRSQGYFIVVYTTSRLCVYLAHGIFIPEIQTQLFRFEHVFFLCYLFIRFSNNLIKYNIATVCALHYSENIVSFYIVVHPKNRINMFGYDVCIFFYSITLIRFGDILVLYQTFRGVSGTLKDLYMFKIRSIKPIECG